MSAGLNKKSNWLYLTFAGALCFTLGCFYVLDIRIDGTDVALGLNAFMWLHIGLFVIAFVVGASQPRPRACTIMIVSEIAGIIVWVVSILLCDPDNNLWPLGLILFSGCGAIVIVLGMLFGSLAGKLIRKIRNT